MLGGHHMAFNINFNQACIYPTPHHIGVEPRTSFTANNHTSYNYYSAGTYQVLADKAAAMFAIFSSLDSTMLTSAFLSGQTFNDILIGPVEANTGSYANVTTKFSAIASSSDRGLLVSSLSTTQQALVLAAIEQFTADYDSTTASRLLSDYQADYGSTYVAWANSAGTFRDRIERYVTERMQIHSADGQPYALRIGSLGMRATDNVNLTSNDWLVVNATLRAPKAVSTEVFALDYTVILQRVLSHEALVYVRRDIRNGLLGDKPMPIGTIGLGNTRLNVDGSNGSWWQGFRRLFSLGMRHIAEGPDHLLWLPGWPPHRFGSCCQCAGRVRSLFASCSLSPVHGRRLSVSTIRPD